MVYSSTVHIPSSKMLVALFGFNINNNVHVQ